MLSYKKVYILYRLEHYSHDYTLHNGLQLFCVYIKDHVHVYTCLGPPQDTFEVVDNKATLLLDSYLSLVIMVHVMCNIVVIQLTYGLNYEAFLM